MIRGFGGPQMYFAIERLMHRVAVELGLDPLEVIKKNLVPAGSFPYRAAAGALFDSGDYQTAVEKAVNEYDLSDTYWIHRTRRNFPDRTPDIDGEDTFRSMSERCIYIIDRVVMEEMGGGVDIKKDVWYIPDKGTAY